MFTQRMLDKKDNQSRDIFDTFIYRSDSDSLADVQAAGYFSKSRFADSDPGWNGGKLEVLASDGYAEGFIDGATGTFTASISS